MLNSKQVKAIELLSTTNKKKQEIAKEVDVTPSTLSKWLKDEDFATTLKEAYQEVLNGLMGASIKRLSQIINSGNESNAIAGIKLVIQSYGLLDNKKSVELANNEIKVNVSYVGEKEYPE